MINITTREKILIGLFLMLIVASFFIGRITVPIKEKIVYKQGKMVRDTVIIKKTDIVYERIPTNPNLPIKRDTIYKEGKIITVYMNVDTSAIIKDYVIERGYEKQLFDDNNGKLIVGALVQYNRLTEMNYKFTPIEKTVIKPIERQFTPFIQGSYNSFNMLEVGGGIYFNNFGIQAEYITDFLKSGYTIGLIYKF